MELEINHKKCPEKHTKTWKVNNMLLNNQYVYNEAKEALRRHLATNENVTTTIQHLWDTGKAIQGKIHRITGLPQTKQNNTEYPTNKLQ